MPLRPRYKITAKIILFTVILSFFAVMGFVAHNYSQSERFGDETAHMVGGHFMLKGRVPYTDLQFNHQPLNYMIPALIEKVFNPPNLYTYISRQRDSIYVYGLIWNMIYMVTFGFPIFIFSVIFELSKYWLAGYKVLGETFAVYPMLYMIGLCLKLYVFKQKITRLHLILFSISTFLAAFSLLPLWPLLFILNVLLLFYFKNNKNYYLSIILPGVLLTFGLFLYISPKDFIKETMVYNVKYFLPTSGQDFSFVRMIMLPFASLVPPYTIPKALIAIFTLLFLSSGFLFWKEKKISIWIIFAGLLCLSNPRVDNYDFGSFHLLTWVGALFFIEIYSTYYFWTRSKEFRKISQLKFVIILIAIVWLYAFTKNPLNQRKNVMNENYVHYSDSESFGKAIKILKDNDDRLIALPGDVLIYKVADIDSGTRVLEYFYWVYTIPEYKKEISDTFKNNPPEFIVSTGLRKNFEIEKDIEILLKRTYIRLNHVGKPSNLYILRKKIPSISEKQWQELKTILFTKP